MPQKQVWSVYVGPVARLRRKTAMVMPRDDMPEHVMAQFDDATIIIEGQRLGFGWHRFLKSDFKPMR